MSSINGLKINLRVPIGVEYDDDVSLVQVNSKSARSRGQYKYFFIRFRVLKVFDPLISVIRRGLPVNSAVFIAPVPQKVIQNVHQTSHLREYQDFEALLSESRQQFVQNFEFRSGFNQVVSVNERGTRLDSIEKIWVVGHLLELHEHIQHLDLVAGVARGVDHFDVALQDLFVELLLQFTQTDVEINFFFQRERLLDVFFQTPEHERPQQSVDLLDDCCFRLLVFARREQLPEVLIGVEEVRHNEIQESPEFLQIVLQWSTS